MSNMFYRAFEDRYRGSFELIKSRLEIYLPFVSPLKALSRSPKALDLGCGRGEWLELLQQHGFQAKGVDLNEGMLQECKARNLDVFQGDAIAYLKDLPDESLHVISAFHLVEHIPFDILQQLIAEAHRVLLPGGLMILETPNPESLLVGTSSFYLDPTHERPLPSALLSFAVEFAQFSRVKTLFLQEPQNLDNSNYIGLVDVLEGVSPDYAIVSQKAAKPQVLNLFDAPFEKNYGTHLLSIAQRFDQQIQTKVHALQHALSASQYKVDKLTQLVTNLETTLANQQQRIEHLEKQSNNSEIMPISPEHQLKWQTQSLENESDTIKKKISECKQSNNSIKRISISRLLHAILRVSRLYTPKWLKNNYQKLLTKLKKAIKLSLKIMIRIIYVTRLNKLLSKLLTKHPALKLRIQKLAIRVGVINQAPTLKSLLSTHTAPRILETFRMNDSTKCLSSRAAQIYNSLQKAIIENKKGSR